MNETLFNIRQNINSDSLGSTLRGLSQLAAEWRMTERQQELEALASNYYFMKQYLLTGYNDSRRDALYHELKTGAYEAASRMAESNLADENRALKQAKESAAKSRVSIGGVGEKLAQLAGETVQNAAGIADLYSFRRELFDTVFATLTLTAADELALSELLLSEKTSPDDARLIVSAMLLAQQTLFDIRKFRILSKIYCGHRDAAIRQFALTAIALAPPNDCETELYSDEIALCLKDISVVESSKQDLVGLQLQMLLCADTETTRKTIDDEIMPVLRSGREVLDGAKTDEQKIDAIINPDKEEQEMERIEASLDRIRRMRDDGADVFFSGFAKAKRFPFFYSLANWFMPFSLAHPAIAELDTGGVEPAVIARLMEAQTFCDSDKYSFYLTFSRVAGQIPPQLLELLKKGEASGEFDSDEPRDTAYRRRLYLQDLYRFFTLAPMKNEFRNPFDDESSLVFFAWRPLQLLFDEKGHLLTIARQLLRRNYFASINKLLDGQFDELNISYLKIKALSDHRQGNYLSALERFRQALAFEPDNAVLVRQMAETAALVPDFALAKKFYAAYIAMAKDTDTSDEEYRFALCCLQTKDTKRAAETLYKLAYVDERNPQLQQALAWAQLQSGKTDEAAKTLAAAGGVLSKESRIRQALALWQSHSKSDAVAVLSALVADTSLTPRELALLLREQTALCNLPLSATDLFAICDLAFENISRS